MNELIINELNLGWPTVRLFPPQSIAKDTPWHSYFFLSFFFVFFFSFFLPSLLACHDVGVPWRWRAMISKENVNCNLLESDWSKFKMRIIIQPFKSGISFLFSNVKFLRSQSNSPGLFCHILFKRNQCDSDWRLRLNDIINANGCNKQTTNVGNIDN